MAAIRRTILLFSLEPWGDMWYSKHHYAAYLAETNGVYFVSPPQRWRWRDLLSFGVKVRATPEGVNVLDYRNNLPLRLLPSWLARSIHRLNAWKLSRWTRNAETLFWSFHPTPLLDHAVLRRRGTQVIYHVVAPYQIFPNDSDFARRADVVAAINPWYLEHYRRINPNTVLVPHGVRDEDRSHDDIAVGSYRKQWGPYMVMAAGINHRTNYMLLSAVAQRFPNIRLVLVGPLAPLKPPMREQRDELLGLANVEHVGVKHPDELRNIIGGASVGLITYDFEPTQSIPPRAQRTPLKVITYLAQHCPVVSTINSYVPVLDGHGNYKAEDVEHFIQLTDLVLQGRLGVDISIVKTYLNSVSYRNLTGRVIDRLPHAWSRSEPDIQPAERKRIPAGSPVLIISNEAWEGPRYSKHRYALALRDHRPVFFLDPAPSWLPTHPFRWKIRSRITKEGMTVLSYHNAMPLLRGRLRGVNDRIIAARIRRFMMRAGRSLPLLWSFDPGRLTTPRLLNPCISVYHCADDYAFGWGECELAHRSDHVLCIAHDLMPRFRTFNSSITFMPHGLAESDRGPDHYDGKELPAEPGYGLFIGNINDRHDFALWEKMFKANPDINWLLVGPVNVHDRQGLALVRDHQYPNVTVLGPVPYERLCVLIAGCGFGFLYLRQDHPANRISSQKVVQFLAQGKPFFCSWLSEYADRQDLVHMTKDHASALEKFANWRKQGESDGAPDARIAFSEGLGYPALLDKLPFQF